MSRTPLILASLLFWMSISTWSQSVSAQPGCLSGDDIDRMLLGAKTSRVEPVNQDLRDTLLRLKDEGAKQFEHAVMEVQSEDNRRELMRAFRQYCTTQLCPILKRFGWPDGVLVGRDGEAAAFFLLKNSSSVELQKQLLPVIGRLTEKGEIDRSDLAGYVDRIRLSLGLNQLFGTEATISNGFLLLYPIEAEAQVDVRRREYNLAPLSEYLKSLERIYQMPLVKSPARSILKNKYTRPPPRSGEPDLLSPMIEAENEIIRVETNLVSLDVSVYNEKLRTHVDNLEQKDFRVFEDDHEENITFFGKTQLPFDLVLLIDLSGSTQGKRDVIRKTTRRFIEATRPSDRVAIVTFSDRPTVIAPLTDDRTKLLESIQRIDGAGGTRAWDALKFTLDQVLGTRNVDRRRAVVFITDGADNHLMSFGEEGSRINFADLLETVRRNGTLIIPVYLDTESKYPFDHTVYEYARKTLAMLGEESGGLYYTARKIEDLEGVYEQVIDDLSKIYSLGYRPTNAKRDGSWRTVRIQVVNQPSLVTRVRPGYYAY